MNNLGTPSRAAGEPFLPALRVKGLTFSYGSHKVLESVSMDIYPQTVTAIIGPSGCGKSTFIKALNRMAECEGNVQIEGTVEFFGQNIYDRRVNLHQLRRAIAMVFQKPNPFPFSIYDNVIYGIKISGHPRSRSELDEIVESVLRSVALWDQVKDRLKRSALQLSGGQQQRLCIARALAMKPKVLLLDEPCSCLDPISTAKIEELITSLSEEITIVIVTHNLQQASRVSDSTAFFWTDESRIGKLLEFGSTYQIFLGATQQRTRDYLEGRCG